MTRTHHRAEGRPHRRAVIGGGLAATGLVAGGLAFTPRLSAMPRTEWEPMQGFLRDPVDRGLIPGGIVAIGRRGARTRFLTAGTPSFADKRPVDPDTLWRIYSMTKPVTAMAVMALIDAGALRLDQPLADILPAFARMRVQTTPDGPLNETRPVRTPITIRHLLTHTAGLGYSIIQRGPIRAAYEQAGLVPGRVTRLPIPGYGGNGAAMTLAQFADRLAALPLVYEPGTQWSYSVATDLLGRVIEVASGVPFTTYVQRTILDPLRMASTVWRVPDAMLTRLSTSYGGLFGRSIAVDPAASSVYRDPPAFPAGGAGLLSTARDYDRFLAMLLNEGELDGVRVLSRDTARLAMSNLIADDVRRKGTMIDGFGFGAGGRVSRLAGVGGGTYGWAGIAGTVGFVDRTRGVRAALFMQLMAPDTAALQRGFHDTYRTMMTGMETSG